MILLHTSHSRNTRFNFIALSLFVGLLIGVFIVFSPNTLLAQGVRPDAAGLTQALLAQSIRYQQASPSEKAHLLNDLIQTAVSRQEQLLAIIEENPAEVIRLAVPVSIREGLPPALRAYVEQEVEIEGMLEVIDEDYERYSRVRYYLETGGERLSLHFVDHRPEHLLTGAKIRVKGVRVDNTLALAGGGGKVKPVVPAPVPSTVGELRTLVILVYFEDNPIPPYEPQEAEYVVFGETNSFFLENSYQQAWLSGEVAGWYQMSLASTVCDYTAIASQAQSAAAAAGFNLADYTHYLYVFPQNACGWWGLSTVGGNPSQSWVNGSLELAVTAHELGHGLGLWHSHALDCGTATIGTVMSSTFPPDPGTCYVIDYGNVVDAMGGAFPGHYNAFQKERLGWLKYRSAPLITTVTTSGSYILKPYEGESSNPNVLKILKSTDSTTGAKTWYYVEFRQPIGFDSFLATTEQTVRFRSAIQNGALISLGTEGNGNSSQLLDMNPVTDTIVWEWLSNAPLLAGQSFSDPTAGVTIGTQVVTSTEASVTVTFGLSLTVSTDKLSYTPGESVSISAQVIYNGSPLSQASVVFTITKPGGAVVTGTATTGTNGIALFKLRLSRPDPTGIYQVSAKATKGVLSGSASTKFTVQ